MTEPRQPLDEATMDLLVKQVSEGLSADEQRALDALDDAALSGHRRDLEHAAAAVTLSGLRQFEPLPAALRARIERQAQAFAQVAPGERPSRRLAWAGWFAAAACLLLAVFGWLRLPQTATAPSPAERRAALAAKPGTLHLALGATHDPAAAGVVGDVVWDPATQQGFLRFVGLAPNDPKVSQYQLWIFDGGRDQRYPVDGGVFDVPAGRGEVLVPIHAALPIGAAQAFAVTVEKPGGVVVSAREHVVVLGQAG